MEMVYAERAKLIPDVDRIPEQKGIGLSKTPIMLKSGDWALNVVPWIGGRIISMMHLPSGNIMLMISQFIQPVTVKIISHIVFALS